MENGSPLSAEEAGADYGASAHVQRPLSARNEEDATAAATSVDLTTRPLALETMKDVFAEIPGAMALASGGYGAFQSVSLRGSDQAQTVWLLGDVPLNGPDSGAFDMSLLPLPQFARLEVYRGGAPVWFGQGSIGGVIRVVPREGTATGAKAQVGAGSFGTYEARASSYVSRLGLRPISLYSGVQVTSAQNDFRYRDDNGTLLGTNHKDDDVERRLKNAQVLDGTGLLHLRTKAARGHVDMVLFAVGRTGGAPGSGGHGDGNALRASRELHRGLFSLAYTREGKRAGARRYRLQALGSAQGEERETDDPVAELGLVGSRALEQNQGRLTGRLAGSLELTRVLEATVIRHGCRGPLSRLRRDPDLSGRSLHASHRGRRRGATSVRARIRVAYRVARLGPCRVHPDCVVVGACEPTNPRAAKPRYAGLSSGRPDRALEWAHLAKFAWYGQARAHDSRAVR